MRPAPPSATVRRLAMAAALALVAVGCGTPPSTPSPTATSGGATLALLHATLVDGTGAAALTDAGVIVRGDRIVAVGPVGSLIVSPETKTYDLTGTTLLPGFINAHVHHGFDETRLASWAAAGVLTVRDEDAGAGQISGFARFRSELEREPHLARLVSFGQMLAAPGGYGELDVRTPEEARAAVRREIEAGVDGIKVANEDGYAGTTGLPKLTPNELSAIVETAHAAGLRVSGHVTQSAYIPALLDAGVDDIAHVPYDPIPADVMSRMVSHGVRLTPTFTVFRNYGAPVDGCVENVRAFVEAGGIVALGNDYGGGPGDFETGIPMYELEKLAEAGLTPLQVVTASTRNAAEVVGLEKDLGTIEAGKLADILVVRGDPLSDLHRLANVRLVVHDGIVIVDSPST